MAQRWQQKATQIGDDSLLICQRFAVSKSDAVTLLGFDKRVPINESHFVPSPRILALGGTTGKRQTLFLKGGIMSEQRKKILDMVAQGKLTPEEADRLLGAIKESHERARFFRVRVYNENKSKPKVKVDIPISVLKLASKIGTAFKGVVPEGHKVNIHGKEIALDEFSPEMLDEIVESLSEGGRFKLVEVTDEEKGEFVEVYIE